MGSEISGEFAQTFIDNLVGGPSERSRRRAITSLTNLFFELWARNHQSNRAVTQLIFKGLGGVADDRAAPPSLRLAAARSLVRMVEHLRGQQRVPELCEEATERLRGLARRRQDHREIVELARDAVNRWQVTSSVATQETLTSPGTERAVCPLFPELTRRQPNLNRAHQSLAHEVAAILAAAIGYRPANFEEGVELATQINELAARYGLRMTRPDDSDLAVTLSFRKIGGANPGAFVFRTSDSTRYAGITVPAIRVVPT